MRGSPSRHSPTLEGAHPNPDDCRTKRARTVRRSGVVAAPLDSGSHPIHKVRTPLRGSPHVLDRIWSPTAAARKIAVAGPMRVRQSQELPAADLATRHPDLNAEPCWSKISGARPEKAEHRPPWQSAGFPRLLCTLD